MHEPGADTSPLRIGVLADTIDRPGGIGRYSNELVAALGRRADVRLVVAAPATARDRVHDLAGASLDSMVAVPALGQLGIALWERYVSGPAFAKAGVALVHSTKHLVPRSNLPTVLTVHDVMTITRANESPLAKRLFLPRQYRTSLRSATRLVATSNATRDRLRDLDPAWFGKTVVVLNALSRTLVDIQPQPVPGLVDRDFALVVGDLAPRKNVGMLLGIWDAVARATHGLRLVVLGHPGPHSAETSARLVALESVGQATWLRHADDRALRWCYEHARVVLFPSLEEGFGFPLIEALTFGAPVIASTDPALVEVAGGSELVEHHDGRDPDAWIQAVTRASKVARQPVKQPELPPGTLTWDEYAARLMPVYRALVAARG